jgi:DNA-binding NtrC family response regulator
MAAMPESMASDGDVTAVRATVLFVDDERNVLTSLRALFRDSYRVLSTTDPDEALRIVRRESVDVIVSDQRMPQMLGAELLRRVREVSPGTMRILLTGYSDLSSVVSSINDGEVFRFINKPWSNDAIRSVVASAVKIARETLTLVPAGDASDDGATGAKAAVEGIDAGVLVIDDEGDLLEVCRVATGESPRCFGATDLAQVFPLLEREPIDIVVTDLEVGGQDISDFVKLLKARHPAISTIVASRSLDSDVAIRLINEGQVYRYLKRPAPRGLMRLSLISAARHAGTVRAQPVLQQRFAVEEIQVVRNQSLLQGLLSRLWPFRRGGK